MNRKFSYILCCISSFLEMNASKFLCSNPLKSLGLFAPTNLSGYTVLQNPSESC